MRARGRDRLVGWDVLVRSQVTHLLEDRYLVDSEADVGFHV